MLLSIVCISNPARADNDEEIAIGVLVGGFALADVGFIIRSQVLLLRDDNPDIGPSIAETAVAAPQALFCHIGLAVTAYDRYDADDAGVALGIIGMVPSALTAHGVWSIAQPDVDPGRLYGMSTIIGINSIWTNVAINGAMNSHLPLQGLGVGEIITSTPSLAVTIHQAATSSDFRLGYIATSVWSGLILLHGAGAIVWADDDDDDDYARSEPAIHNALVTPAALPTMIEGAPPAAALLFSGQF